MKQSKYGRTGKMVGLVKGVEVVDIDGDFILSDDLPSTMAPNGSVALRSGKGNSASRVVMD